MQQHLSLTSIAILTCLIFLVIKLFRKAPTSSSNRLPPGPHKLPIIGDLHRLGAVPFRSYRDLAKIYGPIMHLKLGQVSTIVVSSPEVAKIVVKDQDPCFANRAGSIGSKVLYNYRDFTFCEYGEYWRQMKKIGVMGMMSAKRVRSFGYIRNEEVSNLIETIRLSDGKPINFSAMIFELGSSIACRAAFGKVSRHRNRLIDLIQEFNAIAAGYRITDLFPSWKFMNAFDWTKLRLVMMGRKLDVILDEVINDHKAVNISGKKAEEDEDLVDVLLRVKEEGELQFPIHNDNIKAILFDMFNAATDGVSISIDWTMTELIRNPRVMAKVQAEIREVFKGKETLVESDVQKLKYLKLVLKESLRLHPPIPVVPRASREEITVNGYNIPAGTKVWINSWAMQRDPKYWDNPESFEPERFETCALDFIGADFEFLPFGAGTRMCPGITFAFANMELSLAQLLYHFNWKLPDGADPKDLNMIEAFKLSAPRKDNLFLIATPYQASA